MNNFGYVLATKMLVDGKRKVHYMYRETPDNNQDSGWRFFCGDEDDEYVNTPDNIAVYDINTILSFDKSITPYLNAAVGTTFERENENACFAVSEDFLSDKDGE